ncbi:hypothetical protein ACFQ51_46735 [Streptomyces kaempferi]
MPLRTDAAHAIRGGFYGYVTAKSATGEVVAHTTVSLVVHAPQHRLTVVVRDRNGKVVPGALPNIWSPAAGRSTPTGTRRSPSWKKARTTSTPASTTRRRTATRWATSSSPK